MEYQILDTRFGPQRLVKMVKEAVADDWKPQGGPFVLTQKVDGEGYIISLTCQAMIRNSTNRTSRVASVFERPPLVIDES